LTSLTDFAGRLFSFSYDALGRRTGLTRPNGVNTSYTYDPLSRLLSVLHQAGSSTLDGASYAYDAAGNRTSKTVLPSNVTSAYSYDPAYQLTQVLQGATRTEAYTYDAVGNRTYQPGAPYTYNSSNEMLTREGVPYTYDANGNTLSKRNGSGTTSYAWDFENRLTSVTLPTGGVVIFKYDPFGRRIQKSSTSGTTTYVYDGDNIEEELNGASGTLGERYTYGPGIDEPLVGQRQPQIYYYEADGLGSITSLTTPAGAVAATYTYNSFGLQTNGTGNATNWFRYTARQFDSDTALYYYRARYYDPTTGRFISEDPIRLAGGINVYRYAKANPTNLIDPSGLSAINILVIPGTTTATTTQGILVVQVDGITKFQGNSLEPSGTDPNGGRLLPPGVYPAAPYFSPKLNYNDLLLSGTDPMTFVEIHIGNFPRNTEGCILPGLSASPNKVNDSAKAFDKIMNIVNSTQTSDAATGQKTTITVTQF
jgi:RHS repeat-associated protein